MKLAGLRIIRLHAAIVLIAADFAWLHNLHTGRGSLLGLGSGEAGISDLGVLAMLNILGLGLLITRDRRRPYLIGFEVAGVSAIVVYVACYWLFPRAFAYDSVLMGIQRIHDTFMSHLPVWRPTFDRNRLYPAYILVPLTLIYTVVLALPLLVVAVCGGFVLRRVARSQA